MPGWCEAACKHMLLSLAQDPCRAGILLLLSLRYLLQRTCPNWNSFRGVSARALTVMVTCWLCCARILKLAGVTVTSNDEFLSEDAFVVNNTLPSCCDRTDVNVRTTVLLPATSPEIHGPLKLYALHSRGWRVLLLVLVVQLALLLLLLPVSTSSRSGEPWRADGSVDRGCLAKGFAAACLLLAGCISPGHL